MLDMMEQCQNTQCLTARCICGCKVIAFILVSKSANIGTGAWSSGRSWSDGSHFLLHHVNGQVCVAYLEKILQQDVLWEEGKRWKKCDAQDLLAVQRS